MSTLKIELTEQDVREAIAHYVSNTMSNICGDVTFDDIKITIGREYDDRYPGDTGREVFKKAVITVKQG